MMGKIVPILLVSGIMAGCATTDTVYQYEDSHSRAYNLSQAGGLYSAKDYDIPKAQRDGLLNGGTDVTGNALLFNSNHGLGMDIKSSLGLGLLTRAFGPKGVMERDSVFGWIPESRAGNQEEAWQFMSASLIEGIESSLKKGGFEFIVDKKNFYQDFPLISEYLFSSVRIIAPEYGCPDWEASGRDYDSSCSISTIVYNPTESPRKIPDFVEYEQYGYGFYANDKADYSRIRVKIPKGSTLDKYQLLEGISREFQPWIFLFVASQKIENGTYTPPMIFERGKVELFIAPEQDE